MTILFRTPQFAEAEEMARLHIACWREAYRGIVPEDALEKANVSERTSMWLQRLADSAVFVLAAYDDDIPVGFIMAGPNRDPAVPLADGQIGVLYILKSHYRLGLGRALMGKAAGWWLGQGGTSLGLGVLSENARAMAFYTRMGGRIIRTGTFNWDGHALSDAIFLFDDLEALTSSSPSK
ncbi:GNAT family N-acetyltransferase [Aestuariivirga sp.]|uniref:GNAT family N-acetyltransferase n=1 Tax=Aestuariivirga sp. TaxID=2650926 RepID=UPI0039E2792D